jgi:hypothetical protein
MSSLDIKLNYLRRPDFRLPRNLKIHFAMLR